MGVCDSKPSSKNGQLATRREQKAKLPKLNADQKRFLNPKNFLNYHETSYIKDIKKLYTFDYKAIGKGTFGEVRAAKFNYDNKSFHQNHSRPYAIKILQ